MSLQASRAAEEEEEEEREGGSVLQPEADQTNINHANQQQQRQGDATPAIMTDPSSAPTHHPPLADCSLPNASASLKVYWRAMSILSHTVSGGSSLVRFSPKGDIAAVALNQKLMVDSKVLFFVPLDGAALSSSLLHHHDPSKKGR